MIAQKICALFLAFLASAVMLTAIQSPIDWSYLAWISLVPFILACSPQPIRDGRGSTNIKPKHLALAAYIVSLCYWLGNLYWVAPITILGWFAFCLFTALLWPILALCLRYCRLKKIPLFLAAGVLFVGVERLQGLFLGGFFWRFLAHSQYKNIALIQIADIFGTAGLSFLIAMVNGLIAELILDYRGIFKIGNFIKTAVVCAALIATIVYGRWRINQSSQFITQGPLVASLQSNIPQSVKREALRGQGDTAEQTSQQIFDELLEKSKAAAKAGAEFIVWPETMVQAVLNERVLAILEPTHSYVILDKVLKEHSKDTAYVLVGAYGGTPQIREDATIHLVQRYNSVFLYRPDGQKDTKRYDKIHLVLFGEVMPFRKSCPFLFNLLMRFNPYDYDYSLDPGSEYTVFQLDISKKQKNSPGPGGLVAENNRIYKFSVMICYEATLPYIARRFALDKNGQKQVDWLVNVSNDGWFVRFKNGQTFPSTELPQHAAICAFRAVENRLPVLRSVNTGISCLIDSLGRIRDGYVAANTDFPPKAMQRQGLAGWFVDEMPIDKRITFFSKFGQWLDFSCAICLVLLIIGQLLEKIFRSPKNAAHLSGMVNEKHAQKN